MVVLHLVFGWCYPLSAPYQSLLIRLSVLCRRKFRMTKVTFNSAVELFYKLVKFRFFMPMQKHRFHFTIQMLSFEACTKAMECKHILLHYTRNSLTMLWYSTPWWHTVIDSVLMHNWRFCLTSDLIWSGFGDIANPLDGVITAFLPNLLHQDDERKNFSCCFNWLIVCKHKLAQLHCCCCCCCWMYLEESDS